MTFASSLLVFLTVLERLGINYNIQPAYGWTDSGRIKEYKRPEKINKNLFKLCCAKHFTTLTDGKIIYISSNDGIYNQKTTDAWLSGNVVIQETDRYIYSDNLDLKFTESFIVAYNNVLYKSIVI